MSRHTDSKLDFRHDHISGPAFAPTQSELSFVVIEEPGMWVDAVSEHVPTLDTGGFGDISKFPWSFQTRGGSHHYLAILPISTADDDPWPAFSEEV